jgi:hypothetical protein
MFGGGISNKTSPVSHAGEAELVACQRGLPATIDRTCIPSRSPFRTKKGRRCHQQPNRKSITIARRPRQEVERAVKRRALFAYGSRHHQPGYWLGFRDVCRLQLFWLPGLLTPSHPRMSKGSPVYLHPWNRVTVFIFHGSRRFGKAAWYEAV